MKKKATVLTLVFMFMPAVLIAGTAYYVDCSAGANGNGSYASPWNNIVSVNSHNFNTGDDVYFKVNTTCTPTANLAIDWDGTSADRVIVGAFYGDGQFGLGGNSRPIIDGQHTVPDPAGYDGLIQMTSQALTGYVTIQDLRVNNSGRDAIRFNYVDYVKVYNCYVYRPWKNGIQLARSHDSLVENCTVQKAGYGNAALHSSITGVGANAENQTYNVIFRGNTVFHSNSEGIEFNKMAHDCIIENNAVYDNGTVDIYLDAVKRITVRNNLVYGTTDTGAWAASGTRGIHATCEKERVSQFPDRYPWGGEHKIHNNLVAYRKNGISLSTLYAEVLQDNLIYNNTIIDSTVYNFNLPNLSGAQGNKIKNNISWTITTGSLHSNHYSPTGFSWSHNNFDESASGNATNNAKIYNPGLKKISGWRSLTAGYIDGSEFKITTDSQNKDNGVPIVGYNERINDLDYTDYPITVNTTTDSIPDIGACTDGTWQKMVSLKPPVSFRKIVIE